VAEPPYIPVPGGLDDVVITADPRPASIPLEGLTLTADEPIVEDKEYQLLDPWRVYVLDDTFASYATAKFRFHLEKISSGDDEDKALFEAKTGEVLGFDVPCNPTEFQENLEVEWNRFSSTGATFNHLHYGSTKNRVVEMELYLSARSPDQMMQLRKQRGLLQSWVYPRTKGGLNVGPPRLIAIWPNIFTIECYLVELAFRNVDFSAEGDVTRCIAQIKLEESRDAWINGNDVYNRVLSKKGWVNKGRA
jgi:hypothetical protein